jgi:hypothetical protein
LNLERVAFVLLTPPQQEAIVTRRTYGILAGVIGFGAWWWNRQRTAGSMAGSPERGTVIFRNTPAPTPLSREDVI